MTREEAKQTFTIHTNGSDKFIKVDKRTFDKFIDMIYDDFESRTCSNCRWLSFKSGTQPDGLGWEERDCEANDSFIWEEPLDKWGCSNFERLKDE